MAQFFKADDTSNFVIAITDNAVVPTGYSLVEANSVDAAVEKHVPVIHTDGQKVTVTVGSAKHPMLEEHYIEWIALATKQGNQRQELTPGQEPQAEFMISEDDEVLEVYAYCNLHGLWKA